MEMIMTIRKCCYEQQIVQLIYVKPRLKIYIQTATHYSK